MKNRVASWLAKPNATGKLKKAAASPRRSRNGPTNYTVKVKLYEVTEREKELPIIRGNLAHSNGSNDRPDGTGPDWVDIAEITLEEAR